MKVLKNESEYIYDDLRELQCSVCQKKLWDQGPEVNRAGRIRCPQCGTVYSFEPVRWKVLADSPLD